jgi:hypothetical protein
VVNQQHGGIVGSKKRPCANIRVFAKTNHKQSGKKDGQDSSYAPAGFRSTIAVL